MEELKIAIPNKGRLSEKIYELLNAAGLNFEAKSERCLHIKTQDKKCSLIFVRTQDIPKFLDAKVALNFWMQKWQISVLPGLIL